MASGNQPTLTAHEFVVSEDVRISDIIHETTDDNERFQNELAIIRSLSQTWGRAVAAHLRTSGGDVLSDPMSVDTGADINLANGTVAVCRNWSQMKFGLDVTTDYILVSWVTPVFTAGSPWSHAVIQVEPQLFTGSIDQLVSRTPLSMRTAVFNAGAVALAPDGDRVALLEWRAPRRSDGRYVWLWEDDLTTGQRRLVATFCDTTDAKQVSYSPDGARALVHFGDAAYLVELDSRQMMRVPVECSSMAWHPTAGPGALLTVRPDGLKLELGVFDITTAEHQIHGAVPPIGDSPFWLEQLDVSADGRFAVGLTNAAWPYARLVEHSGSLHTVVIDLENVTADLPFPLEHGRVGVERCHNHPRWLTRVPLSGRVDAADSLLATAEPFVSPDDDTEEARERDAAFAAMERALVKATDYYGPGDTIQQAQQYGAARGGQSASRPFTPRMEAEPAARPRSDSPSRSFIRAIGQNSAGCIAYLVLAAVSLIATVALSVLITFTFTRMFGEPGFLGSVLGLAFWTAAPWVVTYRLARAALRRSVWSQHQARALASLVAFALLVELAIAAS